MDSVPPPGRRGRRWSFDAAIPLMSPPTKSIPIPKRNRSRSVVGPESIFAPPPLAERHHGFLHQKLQKNWRKLQQRRHSFSIAHRDFIVLVTYDDGSTEILTGGQGRSVKEVLNSAGRMELRISSYRVIMSSSRSSLPSFTSTMSMAESLEDLMEEFPDGNNRENRESTDGRYASLHNLLESERVYQQNLRTIFDTYAEPLRKFSALSKDEHKLLFYPVEPILSVSIMLSSKLEDVLRQWDPGTACMGSLFSKKFWEQYEEFISSSKEAREYIKEKRKTDEPFAEFCELRRGSLDQLSLEELLLLPVRRLPRYEHHLRELLEETDESHPDFEDLTRALERVKEMVVEHDVIGDGVSDMETIQDRFPYDDLQLTKKEQPVLQGLQRRRRSAPGALLFKTLGSSRSRSAGNLSSATAAPFRKDDFIQTARLSANRYFIKEGPVQLTLQGQTQERYLFLFNDVLLIAKPKSGSTYKLKQRLKVSDLWTGTCVEEVAEPSRYLQQSFVLGWPVTNQAVTCVSIQDKEDWLQALQNQIEEERKKLEHRVVGVGVYGGEDFEQMKEIQINIRQDAREILKLYVDKCHMSDSEAKDYQLWVMPSPEESSFPLIGHEIPYSICTRGEDGEGETTQSRFFIKNKKVQKRHGLDDRKQKGKTFLSLFKRSSRDSTEIGQTTKLLFGQPLESVMVDEELPKSVMTLLSVLCKNGPQTKGILRKSANEKKKKELKQRLDEGEECVTDDIHVVGALVKDYLRSLPESLLLEDQYDIWVSADDITNSNEKISLIKQLTWQLPACNLVLLRHVMCILYHIDRHSAENSMGAFNLSICMAQSMLRSKGTGTVQPARATKANSVLQFMIENCVEIFGEEVTELLEYSEDKADSGTDTDSIPETNGNLRRDDSSIDSLEKDDPREMESSPRIAKSHLSPVNLSNDSGVTLSDSQLVSDEGHYTDHKSPIYRRQFNSQSSSSESLRQIRSSHISVGKRCSADSLCSVEESSEHEVEDRHDLRQRRTFGAIIKSASGDHLYPSATERHSCETHSDSEIQSRPRDRLMRQASVNSSTPPLSPQPKLSYSSDSLLSDSSASYLRETGGFGDGLHNPPHITSSHPSYSQTLTINHNSKQKLQKSSSGGITPSDPFSPAHSVNVNQRRYSDESIQYHVSPPDSPIASSPRQRLSPQQRSSAPNHRHSIHMFVSPNSQSHSSVESDSSVHSYPPLSLAAVRSDDVTDSSPPKNINPKPTWRFSGKQIITGSPPPRILLQTYSDPKNHRGLQSSTGPRLISHSQSKPELSHSEPKDNVPSHSMESRIVSVTRKQHNVIRIKPKSANKKQSEAIGPNYLSQVTVQPRPQYPPSYLEALDRKERISKGLSVDVSLQDTVSQKRASAHAKQLYEQSVRQFMNDAPSHTRTSSSQSSSSEDDVDFHPDKDPKQVYEESMRQFMAQQSSERRRVSLDTSAGVSRSNSAGSVGSHGSSRVTVNCGNHGYTSHNPPDKLENRTIIHIPSVRDSKLFEARNRGLPTASSYSRSPRHSMPSSSKCFYDPKGLTENRVSDTVHMSHHPSKESKLDSGIKKQIPHNKSYLSWSVADLRKQYDESRAQNEASVPQSQATHVVTVSGSRTPGHQQSVSRPPPPPYQHPPPFRRNSSDVERKGSSRSNSSEDSGSTSHSVRRTYQPQHL